MFIHALETTLLFTLIIKNVHFLFGFAGFGMNPGSNIQMSNLQQQQMRMQLGMSQGGMGPGSQQTMGPVINQGPSTGGPISQMASMNQQQHMQLMQQQNMIQQHQQQNSQVNIKIHLSSRET